MTTYRVPHYGRTLEEFVVGAVYHHPWDVTIDAGMLAMAAGSFVDATPVFASARYARTLGFRDRPVHPLVLLNLGTGFSVHDVSEQAIAHLGYNAARFPHACYEGDSVRAASTVLAVRRNSNPGQGVVQVRTVVRADDERVVCQFERKILVRSGAVTSARPPPPTIVRPSGPEERSTAPAEINGIPMLNVRDAGFSGYFADFAVGDIVCHSVGRTVSEAEHMQLTSLFRNTHPLHVEAPYAASSFAKTRVVCGGLVFAWVASLASRDTGGNVVWEDRYDNGAHPAPVVAGDTLYAASKVLAREDVNDDLGRITWKHIGTKNRRPSELLDAGADLFADEHAKASGRTAEKVFEIERTVLVRRRV